MYLKVDSANKASHLSNKMKDGNWIVLYYANWCGHCNTMKPEWQKVISRMKTHNTNCNSNRSNTNTNKSIINIADIESTHIDHLTDKPEIAGFPTIKMYNSGNEIANFEDERVADKIHQFAILNSKNTSMQNTTNTAKKTKKSRKTRKSKKAHKSKTKGKGKGKSVYGSSHRIPPKMIDLNMKNNQRMPINISKLIGFN
jgi:hypothetical protein